MKRLLKKLFIIITLITFSSNLNYTVKAKANDYIEYCLVEAANKFYLGALFGSGYMLSKIALNYLNYYIKKTNLKSELNKYNQMNQNEQVGLSQLERRVNLPDDAIYNIRSFLDNPKSKMKFKSNNQLHDKMNENEISTFLNRNSSRIRSNIKTLVGSLLLYNSSKDYIRSINFKTYSSTMSGKDKFITFFKGITGLLVIYS